MNFKTTARRLWATLLVLVMMLSVCPLQIAAEDGNWYISDDTEIFLVNTADAESAYASVSKQVKLFASELAEKVTTTALPISYGAQEKAGENDIVLVLDNASGIAAEGYVIKVADSQVTISASDADGLFYGCRELIKQLLLNGSVTNVTDAPDVAERAVSLDNGRKYFSVDWIKQFIREMSWANMNTLVLHFSEEMGLGIESKLYPWLNGRDGTLCTQAEVATDNTYLTQEQVKEIAEYAKLYHIELVPSLDSPGHMNYIVKKFNENCAEAAFTFTYQNQTYTVPQGTNIGNYFSYNGKKTDVVPGSRNAAYSRGIDISNEIAVAFTKSLIEEYAVLFKDLGCTKFDIGGDELLGWGSAVTTSVSKWKQLDHWKAYAQEKTGNSNAVAYDAFLLYMNDLNDLVRELGYTSVRMWNDDVLRSDAGWNKIVNLDENIDIWFWSVGSKTFVDYVNAGYQQYNIVSEYNYYAMTSKYFSEENHGGDFSQSYPDQIYNEWTPYIFYPDDLNKGWPYNPGTTNPNVLGGAFGVWCDNPTLRTEKQVMTDLLPLIRANAAKSWDTEANEKVAFDVYTENWTALGSAPAGIVAAGDIYAVADLTELQAAVEAYGSVDSTMYTSASFADYTSAVEAGKALLAADKPDQADVDSAVAAIHAAKDNLQQKPTTDTSPLQNLVNTCRSTYIAEHYTVGSFEAYENALNAAIALLESNNADETAIDGAIASLDDAVENLVFVDNVDNETEWFVQGAFKTSRVYVGKVATLSVSTENNANIDSLIVYNQLGEKKEIVRSYCNTRNTSRDIYTLIFTVGEEERNASHTYRVYAKFKDGSVSADCRTFIITVK